MPTELNIGFNVTKFNQEAMPTVAALSFLFINTGEADAFVNGVLLKPGEKLGDDSSVAANLFKVKYPDIHITRLQEFRISFNALDIVTGVDQGQAIVRKQRSELTLAQSTYQLK